MVTFLFIKAESKHEFTLWCGFNRRITNILIISQCNTEHFLTTTKGALFKTDLVELCIISWCCFEHPEQQHSCRCLPSSPGTTGYKTCYQEVLKVVKGIIHQPLELKDDNVFYAFSYYYDRAVDAGLIGE